MYADVSKRFAAFIIDEIIIFAVCFSVYFVMYFVMNAAEAANSEDLETFAVMGFVFFAMILTFLYFTLFESSPRQATPGKMIFYIKVTDYEGRRISFKTAMVRYIVRCFMGFTFYIGYLMCMFTKKKQTLYDMAAGTVVIDAVNQADTLIHNDKDKYTVKNCEDPEGIWQCPKCNSDNPNTTYKCKACDYKLI